MGQSQVGTILAIPCQAGRLGCHQPSQPIAFLYGYMPGLTVHFTLFCILISVPATAQCRSSSSSSDSSSSDSSSSDSIQTTKGQTCKQVAMLSSTEVTVSWTSQRLLMHASSLLHLLHTELLYHDFDNVLTCMCFLALTFTW